MSRGALLLERVTPGAKAEDAADADVAELLDRLHVPAPAGLPGPGRDRAAADRRAEKRGTRLAAAARVGPSGARASPATTHRNRVLVHGDFDERNLLVCDRRGLCAIDPLPCAGDGAYDAAYWIHANRQPGRRARFEAMAAATGVDRRRLRDWCGIVAVHG